MTRAELDAQRLRRIVVVLASMYLIMAANGGMLLLVVGLKQIASDFGWPRSVPSLAYSLLFVGTGIGGIAMGHWFDRSGVSPVIVVGVIMIGVGALLGSQVQAPWHLYVIYGLMMGLVGHAAIYGPLVLNIISWFGERRGFAIGLITAGQGIGGVVWPLLFRHVNETAGWRETFFWFGFFMLLTAIPTTFALRKQPAPISIPSERSSVTPLTPPRAKIAGLSTLGIQVILCMAIVGCCISMSMPMAHLVSHASDVGHSTARAAEMLAVALLTATVARLTCGTLIVDRFGPLIALLVFSGCQALSLAFYAFSDGLVALYAISILFGFGYGGISMCYPLIVRDQLPATESGRRLGVVLLFGALGMALGGWLAGVMFDHSGGYATAFWIGVVFNVANLLLILFLIYRQSRYAVAASPA